MAQRDRQALEDILVGLDRALEFPIPDAQTLEDTTYLQDAVICCLEVLGEATTRAAQFTSGDFVARRQVEENKISCSGRKRCYNNIVVERLWRTVKYVTEGFSAKPCRGLPARLQRWTGG